LPTRSLGNEHLRLEYLAEAGPRIVRLFLAGSEENLLAEIPEVSWETPYGRFFMRGGHRLWHAPEAFPRSNVPDNDGLRVEPLPDGVRLCPPVEAPTGIRKTLEIRLNEARAGLTLLHHLENEGLWPVELAPWAITQMPLGGVAVLPQQTEPLDSSGLLPNRQVVLWPYTRWGDPRLRLNEDYILIEAQPYQPPVKVGYLNRKGWLAYLREGVLFCKRFEPRPEQPHVDFGCNVEVYASDLFIEIETVAPLSRLEPGQWVAHVETWEFYSGLDVPQTLDGVRTLVGALGL
jgi:hypothetical protein